jgi:hypothetical protein
MIRCKLRMQRETHEAAFASRLNVRDDEQWLRLQLAVLKNPNAARTLGENHATVGRPNDRPGHLQIPNDRFNFEACLRLRRVFNFTSATACWRVTTRKQHC